MRRFASPHKGFAKQRPGLAKCGLREAWERSDLGERNPGAPNGRGTHTVPLYDVPLFTIISSLNISHNILLILLYLISLEPHP
jgi:hypothetical protein